MRVSLGRFELRVCDGNLLIELKESSDGLFAYSNYQRSDQAYSQEIMMSEICFTGNAEPQLGVK